MRREWGYFEFVFKAFVIFLLFFFLVFLTNLQFEFVEEIFAACCCHMSDAEARAHTSFHQKWNAFTPPPPHTHKHTHSRGKLLSLYICLGTWRSNAPTHKHFDIYTHICLNSWQVHWLRTLETCGMKGRGVGVLVCLQRSHLMHLNGLDYRAVWSKCRHMASDICQLSACIGWQRCAHWTCPSICCALDNSVVFLGYSKAAYWFYAHFSS